MGESSYGPILQEGGEKREPRRPLYRTDDRILPFSPCCKRPIALSLVISGRRGEIVCSYAHVGLGLFFLVPLESWYAACKDARMPAKSHGSSRSLATQSGPWHSEQGCQINIASLPGSTEGL